MGLCASDTANAAALEASRRVEAEMAAKKRAAERRLKLLLLGSGESGKSTIFKQMRLLHGPGFSDDERKRLVKVIKDAILAQMDVLVDSAKEMGETITDADAAEKLADCDVESFDASTADIIERLWADEGIQRTYDARSKFQLNDSAAYFFERVKEVARPDYIASTEDVLRTRVKTLGIVEEEFTMDGDDSTVFVLFDVGGQQTERRKWIHCFEDVAAVLFVVAISEYDQVLYEDAERNRLHESLDLFDEIVNSRWFEHTAIILFLNKKDLFKRKIARTDIRQVQPDGTVLFEDYEGGCDYSNGLKYILDLFIARNKNEERELFYHVTTATSSTNIKAVLSACKAVILRESLSSTGFLS